MTTISAQTILRSRHAQRPDKVLSTLLLRYPRWIHAELMTHRVLSRNAASSRAIPVAKLIQDVLDNPAMPIHWGKNQKGMQASAECNEPVLISGYPNYYDFDTPLARENAWLLARSEIIRIVKAFDAAGYHKQVINRLLEPFAHITVLVSATEWSNFLALRDHPDAEPHITMLAREIRKELDREDNIQLLQPGQWHLPFVNLPDDIELAKRSITANGILRKIPMPHEVTERLIKKSVACCASTSYKTVDGFDMTIDKAVELHDKLVGSTPLHASPAEHVAQADEWCERADQGDAVWLYSEQHGNFAGGGFRQYRKMLPGESL